MTHDLESTFRELGIAQYLNAFVDQGFDSWETILDIQESDLDTLGVKLGHRRKLQRRIANARGLGPSISLSSRQQAEDGKSDGSRGFTRSDTGHESNGSGVTKRKYRRHPKPDENAPERPPSAYVLFSNKMREDLKGHSLTFTEIAKLVGENWQSLPAGEKEAYESQANTAKEKYHRDLVEYKKTPEYKKYALYLQEFKDKQAKQSQSQDANKRARVEPARPRHGSTSSSAATGGTSGSASLKDSRSGSEYNGAGELSPIGRDRINSMSGLSQLGDGAGASSPQSANFDFNSQRKDGHQALPPLSDIMDNGRISIRGPQPPERSTYTASGFVPANVRRTIPGAPLPPPSRHAPYLRREDSSTDTIDSGASAMSGNSATSSMSSVSRSSGEGMPIHALLTNRPLSTKMSPSQSSSPTFGTAPQAPKPSQPSPIHSTGPQGYGFQSAPSALQHMKIEHATGGDVVMTSPPPRPFTPASKPENGLNGMDALLRAGELASRSDGPR